MKIRKIFYFDNFAVLAIDLCNFDDMKNYGIYYEGKLQVSLSKLTRVILLNPQRKTNQMALQVDMSLEVLKDLDINYLELKTLD